jgi:hypothetical protein
MLILIVYNYLCVTRKGCSILVFQVEIQDVDIAVMKYWYPTIIKKKKGNWFNSNPTICYILDTNISMLIRL